MADSPPFNYTDFRQKIIGSDANIGAPDESIHEIKKSREELEKIALIDRVTGISNDKAFFRMLEGLMDNYNRDLEKGIPNSGTFVVLDLTGLHNTNDRFGKERGGNDYLRSVADALGKISRPGDRYFRMGTSADEFVLHLHDQIDRKNLEGILDRMDEALAELQQINQTKYPGIEFGVSYSIASYGKNFKPDQAFEIADRKLGEAKQSKIKGRRVGNVGRIYSNNLNV